MAESKSETKPAIITALAAIIVAFIACISALLPQIFPSPTPIPEPFLQLTVQVIQADATKTLFVQQVTEGVQQVNSPIINETNTPTSTSTSTPSVVSPVSTTTFIPADTPLPTTTHISFVVPTLTASTGQIETSQLSHTDLPIFTPSVMSVISNLEDKHWGSGSGDHANILRGEEDAINNVNVLMKPTSSNEFEGRMWWESSGPIGSKNLDIQGVIYITKEQIENDARWSFIDPLNTTNIVFWLVWTMGDNGESEVIAVTTSTGKMMGAVYNRSNNTLIWTFNVYERN